MIFLPFAGWLELFKLHTVISVFHTFFMMHGSKQMT